VRLIAVITDDWRNDPKNHSPSFRIGPPKDPSNWFTSDWTGVPPVDTHSLLGQSV